MKLGQETASHPDIKELLWLRINQAPERIFQAAIQVLDVSTELENREVALADKAGELLTTTQPNEGYPAVPLIDGKTEAIRKAQLCALTEHERMVVRAQQVVVERAKIGLRLEQDRFSAAKALVRLLEEKD
jgi:hypothetical protein